MTVWMTECKGDCSTWNNPAEGDWFKIFQSGLVSGTVGKGKWGTNEMMEKGFSLTVKIPASLKPGNYLIRHETIVSLVSPRIMGPLVTNWEFSRTLREPLQSSTQSAPS
jgi:hypothetical protein